jgi:purine-nucleoside phosphorylase
MNLKEKVDQALAFLHDGGIRQAEIGIILGTGLGALINDIEIEKIVEYSTIPHFPLATVETHQGKLVFGRLANRQVVAMQGRFHYYEGYDMKQITFPLYVMKMLGIKALLISNAAGNLNPEWHKGELMLIEDHINLLPENPLRGKNDDFFGPRFPDMSQPYDRALNKRISTIAVENNITMRKGVYASVEGPNLETRAEYRYLRRIGADAVGMSTVPEVIVAKYLNIPVCAVSVLTDDCDPDNLKPINIHEIIAIAKKAEEKVRQLFKLLVSTLD